jgi:hypothetical protein
MTSTTISRSCHCLAATALLAGISFAAPPVASADFNQTLFDECVQSLQDPGGPTGHDFTTAMADCCDYAGGVWVATQDDAWCYPPTATDEGNAPGKPGVTVPRVPDVGASNPPAPTKPGVNVPIVPGNSVG